MSLKKILSVTLFAVAILAAGTTVNADNAATLVVQSEKYIPTYEYLKGTKYKNLIKTRYPALVETLNPKVEEPQETEEESVSQNQIGSAVNYGYQGTIGTYSLNDKTIAAHLSIPGTSIVDRPVWQCSTSSSYYESSSVAWAAKTAHLRSGELSQNTVIYGHNWKNCFVPFKLTGSQFEPLMSFYYPDFCQQYQYIYLTTNSGVHTYRVFAAGFTKDLSFYINCNGINVADIASQAKRISLHDFGVSVSSSDKIITLSTCCRYFSGLGANQRFIVMGKLVS